MHKIISYHKYLEKMMVYHQTIWEGSSDPYHAQNCRQQYLAFKQAFERFESVLQALGVDHV